MTRLVGRAERGGIVVSSGVAPQSVDARPTSFDWLREEMEEAARETAKWPAWKRDLRLWHPRFREPDPDWMAMGDELGTFCE